MLLLLLPLMPKSCMITLRFADEPRVYTADDLEALEQANEDTGKEVRQSKWAVEAEGVNEVNAFQREGVAYNMSDAEKKERQKAEEKYFKGEPKKKLFKNDTGCIVIVV